MFDSMTNIFGIYSHDRDVSQHVAQYASEYYGFRTISMLDPVVKLIDNVFSDIDKNNQHETFDPAKHDTEFYVSRLIEGHNVLTGKSPPQDFMAQLIDLMYKKLPMPVFYNRTVSLFSFMVRVTNNSSLTSAALTSMLALPEGSRIMFTDLETNTETLFIENLGGIVCRIIRASGSQAEAYAIPGNDVTKNNKNFSEADVNSSVTLVDTGDTETLLASVDMMMSVFGDSPVKQVPKRDTSSVPIVDDGVNMLMMYGDSDQLDFIVEDDCVC